MQPGSSLDPPFLHPLQRILYRHENQPAYEPTPCSSNAIINSMKICRRLLKVKIEFNGASLSLSPVRSAFMKHRSTYDDKLAYPRHWKMSYVGITT